MLSPSLSRNAGGIFEIERNLTLALHSFPDVAVDVFGLHDKHTEADRSAWAPLSPNTFAPRGPRAFGYAPALIDALEEANPDVLHLHAMWMYTSVASLSWARRTGQPHLVTINGMLDTWAVNNSGWKKKLAGWVYEHANLREAACLQVNTEKELHSVRDYGIDTPACIIPNGVELPDEPENQLPPWADVIPAEQNVLFWDACIRRRDFLNYSRRGDGGKKTIQTAPQHGSWPSLGGMTVGMKSSCGVK